MKLSEKILFCRKRAGLSQEALAEKIGISRQAISKWETGEAVPEITKLLLLSHTFGVTTDWLLSEDFSEADFGLSATEESSETPERSPSQIEEIPGVIGAILKRFGWLFGVYVAIVGFGMFMMGILASSASRSMMNDFGATFPSSFTVDHMGNLVPETVSNPVSTMGTGIAVLGFLIMAAGIGLAIYLKSKSNPKSN
ncbi:MAG: helix-turn-helix transcriptional regulator [Tissierellia bacterium]|nr:helix-turn-helix transcriptional regulator [Tissierellia bacterium]